ncbi:sulfatase-like hydrolase/transferase [Kiritimatiellota bacterium B12222]|nr:sulfatase-like hydrolase/transferase [Kiritimatiellota bacterium B12222]
MKTPLNIMLLQGEDVGRHLGCYGDVHAHTPHLDSLASQGMRFTHAFTHAPVSAPSRGGMVTGCYPYSLGNHHMRSCLARPPRTFTQELKDKGYYVNWNTKLDFNFEPQAGWRDEASNWYEKPAPQQPFMLYENFGETHESRMFPHVDDVFDAYPEDCEGLVPHDPDQLELPPYLSDCPALRKQVAKYYNAYSLLDAKVGKRLQWLEDQGLADNTVVIFLSDHGRGLPREKRWGYDAGLHLPLIIRWPGHLEPGTVSDKMVAWVDIAPTLLSLAGAPIPSTYQGQIFLGEQAAAARECVFGGRDRMDEVFDRVRVVRDKQWHYIKNFAPQLPWFQYQNYMEQQDVMKVMRERYSRGDLQGDAAVFFQVEKPDEELYDITADPHCLHNLVEDSGSEVVLEKMRILLDQHLSEVKDLGGVSEEELIAQGILTDSLVEYAARRNQSPRDQVVGDFPYPMTLHETQRWSRTGCVVWPQHQRCISTLGALELTLPELNALCEKYSIGMVELRGVENRLDLASYFTEQFGSPQNVHASFCDWGMKVQVVDSSCRLISDSDEGRQELLALAPWADAMNCPWLRVFDGGVFEAEASNETLQQLVESIEWWREQKQIHGFACDLLVETHDSLCSSHNCLALQSRLDTPVALLWDSWHIWFKNKETLSDTWQAISPYVKHVHFKDGYLAPSARHPFTYVRPGEGAFPLAELFDLFAVNDTTLPLCLEWERKWHPYLDVIDQALSAMIKD